MQVLSLFDGVGGARQALKNADITVSKYYASEIDEKAVRVAMRNHSDIAPLGDVSVWRTWQIEWEKIGLICAGSPCQGFSMAGLQKGFSDDRSSLFYVFLEILAHVRSVNPKVKFFLENVKMKREFCDHITALLGVEPVRICARHFGAIRRDRNYWFNWESPEMVENPQTLGDFVDFDDDNININLTEARMRRLMNAIGDDPQRDGAFGMVVATPNHVANAMLTRSFGNWRLPHIPTPSGGFRVYTAPEMAALHGFPRNYYDGEKLNTAAELVGNGWALQVVTPLLAGGF